MDYSYLYWLTAALAGGIAGIRVPAAVPWKFILVVELLGGVCIDAALIMVHFTPELVNRILLFDWGLAGKFWLEYRLIGTGYFFILAGMILCFRKIALKFWKRAQPLSQNE